MFEGCMEEGKQKSCSIILEVSEKVLVLAPESPLVCKILGSVVKEQLRKINPARVRYTEYKPYTVA
jgi:hypothetical protein